MLRYRTFSIVSFGVSRGITSFTTRISSSRFSPRLLLPRNIYFFPLFSNGNLSHSRYIVRWPLTIYLCNSFQHMLLFNAMQRLIERLWMCLLRCRDPFFFKKLCGGLPISRLRFLIDCVRNFGILCFEARDCALFLQCIYMRILRNSKMLLNI